jgi:uncharacterized protein
MATWHPDTETMAKEMAAMKGNFAEQLEHRIPTTFRFQTFLFLFFIGWRAAGMMLIGMALYKWRILLAEKSTRFYKNLAIIGLSTGLIVIGYGIVENFKRDWSLDFSMFLGCQYNYWGSICVSMGYIGLIMLLYKSKIWSNVTRPLAAVGRMAFTNYLLQTIICTYLFYGHGFNLFGQVERVWQLLIVFIIISIQLIISPIWLKYYQFGPLEWLWRSLTYLKFQPFKL